MRTMGGRLKDTHARLRELQTERVERRIAHAIARLVAQAGRRVEGGILIDFPVSRQDIAEMTGTTLHTVSRTLSAWQERGIVKLGRQKLTVVDPHGLVVIAEDLTADEYDTCPPGKVAPAPATPPGVPPRFESLFQTVR